MSFPPLSLSGALEIAQRTGQRFRRPFFPGNDPPTWLILKTESRGLVWDEDNACRWVPTAEDIIASDWILDEARRTVSVTDVCEALRAASKECHHSAVNPLFVESALRHLKLL